MGKCFRVIQEVILKWGCLNRDQKEVGETQTSKEHFRQTESLQKELKTGMCGDQQESHCSSSWRRDGGALDKKQGSEVGHGQHLVKFLYLA